MKIRTVKITIEIVGATDRDPWEWGDAIARGLKSDFAEGGEEFGPVIVTCADAESVSEERAL